MRKTQFQNEYYYHIYNRGVDKRDVFLDDRDYFNFVVRLSILNNNSKFEERIYYNSRDKVKAKKESNPKALELDSFLANLPKFVDIIVYCLNSNHYHLLLQQKQDNGISKFMHKLATAYTNYFNKKYNRSGSLFQGKYKAVAVKTDEQLQYVSAYINANYEIHKIGKADVWQWASYLDYVGKRQGKLCNKNNILGYFDGSVKKYQEYISEVINNSQHIKEDIKACLIEM